jgi:hypothetical protein
MITIIIITALILWIRHEIINAVDYPDDFEEYKELK